VQEADRARLTLAASGTFLRNELCANGFDVGHGDSQIVPVILGENEAAIKFAEFLSACGFGVRAIRPPTVPEGTARLRFSVTSELSKEALAELVAALVQARAEYPAARALSASS
jgi:8-amino-7-oxononanoate synthase